jgi:Predicted hydrolases or acyltransferases (alpha/beta hydrolase superfamily)
MKWVVRGLLALLAVLVVAFVIFRTPDTDAAEMRAKYGGPPSQFVEIGNGVTVHLRDEGPKDAPAIILLHGSNADLHTWEPWVEALKGQYRVVRFDQVGHGLTGPAPDKGYTRSDLKDYVGSVADTLGLDQFVVGGNSMGGGVALEYALSAPERVTGVVLVDAGGGPIPRPDSGGGNLGFTLMRVPGVRWMATQITPRGILEESLRQSVTNQEVATDEAVDRYWELLRYPGNRAATLERFGLSHTPFSQERLRAFERPVLIQWGDQDPIIPVGNASWFADHLPNSTLHIYKGIGHLPHEEAVEASSIDLKAWLSSLELHRLPEESKQ